MTASATHLAELFNEIMQKIHADASALNSDQLDLPTSCQGWSVRDQVAHIVGLEQSMSGSPEPTVELPDYNYVNGDLGTYMERQIEARRGLPFAAVMDEFAGLLPRRLAQVEALAAKPEEQIANPLGGTGTFTSVMPIRVLDLFAHSLDICHAIGAEPTTEGPVADHVLGIVFNVWKAALPHRVGQPVVLDVATTGPSPDNVRIRLTKADLDPKVTDPTVRINADRDTVFRLAMGRGNPIEVLSQAQQSGHTEVLDAVAPHLAFTP